MKSWISIFLICGSSCLVTAATLEHLDKQDELIRAQEELAKNYFDYFMSINQSCLSGQNAAPLTQRLDE